MSNPPPRKPLLVRFEVAVPSEGDGSGEQCAAKKTTLITLVNRESTDQQ